MALAEHSVEVHNAVQSLRELEALAGSKQHCNTPVGQDDLKPPPCKRARAAGKEPNPAGLRHIETEQRRRDRINEGFAGLREVLPRSEKCDKAAFLMSAVQYIKELQGLLRQVIESGALSHLDSDQQWSLRMLLPRQEKVTFKPVLPTPAYTPMQGQTGAALPPPAQLANTDQMTTLLAALLKPQAPPPQVTDANLQLAQLLLAAQLQAPAMQSALTMLPQGPPTELSAGMLTIPTGLPDPEAALQQDMTVAPVIDPPPGLQAHAQTAGGCSGTPEFQVMPVPKARKVEKARRHTSASRIEKPALPQQAPAIDAGRPAQMELAT